MVTVLFGHYVLEPLFSEVEKVLQRGFEQNGIVIRELEARLVPHTLVQVLLEKSNSVPLRLLKRSLLCSVIGVTARSKAVLNAREVDVLPGNVQLGQLLEGVLLELLSVCEVVLGRKDLDGDLGGIDLGLVDQ